MRQKLHLANKRRFVEELNIVGNNENKSGGNVI